MSTSTTENAPLSTHEAYGAMEQVKLPQVLFHATTAENVASIIEQGLEPRQSMEGCATAVFLSDTIKYAKFCASCQQEVPEDDLVIFAVATSSLDATSLNSKLHIDNPFKQGEKHHEVQVKEEIPVDAIRLLSKDEVSEIESHE